MPQSLFLLLPLPAPVPAVRHWQAFDLGRVQVSLGAGVVFRSLDSLGWSWFLVYIAKMSGVLHPTAPGENFNCSMQRTTTTLGVLQ